MSEEVPAWPPTADCSTTIVESPSEEAYTAAARPLGPAPTTTTSYTRSAGSGVMSPKASAISRSVGSTSVVGGLVKASWSTGSSGS